MAHKAPCIKYVKYSILRACNVVHSFLYFVSTQVTDIHKMLNIYSIAVEKNLQRPKLFEHIVKNIFQNFR